MRSRDLFAVTKFLFLSLVDSLRERGLTEEYNQANEIFKESLSMQDELVLFQGLKRTVDFLAIEKQFAIIFLFDRFEEYVPVLNSEFFSNLRVLRNRAKYRFSAIFSLNKPLEELVEPALFAEFHEFLAGHIVYMGICDEPGLKFKAEYLSKITGKPIEEDLQKQIINLTSGHGKLTRLVMEAVLGSTTNDLKTLIKDAKKLSEFSLEQRTVVGGLKEIWRSFSPVEQAWILGSNRTEENKAVDIYMSNLGLVINGEIKIPLLQIYLNQGKANLTSQNEQIMFDESTNSIRKGKLILSDDLTAAEFRLLKYLLHNSEQVIDREKVIDVVWGNAASTAGVTDQAVDQLIFRLRKKIEENPTSPTHLQTVKGRGFKFTP